MDGKAVARKLNRYLHDKLSLDDDVKYFGTFDDLDATGLDCWASGSWPVDINGEKGAIAEYTMFKSVKGLMTKTSGVWTIIFFVDKKERFYVLLEALEDDKEPNRVWKELKSEFGISKKKKSKKGKKNKQGKKNKKGKKSKKKK